MKRVIIESPYAGDVRTHVAYAKLCVLDSLARGESPYASHLFFTQPGLLDDTDPGERLKGIRAGLAWGEVADLVAIYTDHGVTDGMRLGLRTHRANGVPVVFRKVGQNDIETPIPIPPEDSI